MSTVTASRKQELAERLMHIDQEKFLDQIDEILMKAEMQARVEQSERDIASGNVITLDEFHRRNKEWLKERGIV